MRFVTVVLVFCLGVLCMALPASATFVWSSFGGTEGPQAWKYSYTVTPVPGEVIKDFHVYAGVNEWDITHYLNVIMPPGWNFTVTQLPTAVALTWWTTGAPLPVGVASAFGFTHYCAPCCHSWIVTGTGTSSPYDPPLDGSWNHPEEPCNIPPEFADYCHGPGLVVAPIYPEQTPVDNSTWGRIKVIYR